MGEKTYRVLRYTAIVLTGGWIGWTLYDSGPGESTALGRELAAAGRYLEDGELEQALGLRLGRVVARKRAHVAAGRAEEALLRVRAAQSCARILEGERDQRCLDLLVVALAAPPSIDQHALGEQPDAGDRSRALILDAGRCCHVRGLDQISDRLSIPKMQRRSDARQENRARRSRTVSRRGSGAASRDRLAPSRHTPARPPRRVPR